MKVKCCSDGRLHVSNMGAPISLCTVLASGGIWYSHRYSTRMAENDMVLYVCDPMAMRIPDAIYLFGGGKIVCDTVMRVCGRCLCLSIHEKASDQKPRNTKPHGNEILYATTAVSFLGASCPYLRRIYLLHLTSLS